MEVILVNQVVIKTKIKWTHVFFTIISKTQQYNMKTVWRCSCGGTYRRPLNKIRMIDLFTYFSLQGHSCLINTWCVDKGHFANDIGQIHIFML